MKQLLCFQAAILSAAHAEPAISTLDWRPACDAASIEVISDQKKVLSIRASAFHSAIIAEWSVHYIDGIPVSAEYRELIRGRNKEGDRAGEYSGEDVAKEVQTWAWSGDRFPIKDEARAKELADILTRAKTQAEQVVPPNRPLTPGLAAANPDLAPGVWKNITPEGVTMTLDNHVFCQGVALDSKNPSTLYLCVCAYDVKLGGLFKTTNGGTTWKKVGHLDEPIHVVIDPNDSHHLYCVDGVRGETMGFWKSKDGGESWAQPEGFKVATQKPVGTKDLYSIAVDPTDFRHILVSFHSPWAEKNCGVLESKDGGESWIAHDPPPTLKGGYGMAVFFLFDPAKKIGDKDTWLFTAQEGGFFRTTDGGKTWTNVYQNSMTHGGNQLYRANDGNLYSGGYQYPSRSSDNGATWEQVKTGLTYSWYTGIIGDGKNIYTGSSNEKQPFFVSPEADGRNWTKFNDQTFSAAPFAMALDPVNRILYSASWGEGLLAVKLPARE